MNGAVAVGADALGERFVSIVMKLLRGPASRVGEAPLPVGSTLRPWMAAAPAGRGVPPPPPPGIFTALTIGCNQESDRI